MAPSTKGQRKKRDLASHCAYCERKLYGQGTLEHFYPVSMSPGLNKAWNRIVVCRRCNQMKGNYAPRHFITIVERNIATRKDSVFYQDLQDILKNVRRILTDKEAYFNAKDIL